MSVGPFASTRDFELRARQIVREKGVGVHPSGNKESGAFFAAPVKHVTPRRRETCIVDIPLGDDRLRHGQEKQRMATIVIQSTDIHNTGVGYPYAADDETYKIWRM